MKKLSIYKLGSCTKDTASGLKGTLTVAIVNMHQQVEYLLQPKGTNPEDGKPVKAIWVLDARIDPVERVEVDFPLEVLGTEAEDEPTGFKGMIVNLILHISGCIHAEIQPKGLLEKTGGPIQPYDFDLRRLKGPGIKKMTEGERQESQKKTPSPGHEYFPRHEGRDLR